MTDMLQQSEALIISGFQIFPIKYRDKIPLTPNGFKDASCSFEQLEKWDEQFEKYNSYCGTQLCLFIIAVGYLL